MQLWIQLAAMAAAGLLMVRSALHSRLLERSHFGVCPSCGRTRTSGVCDVCTRGPR